MTEEQIALAKRAVACKGWRFMGGMLLAAAIGKQRVYDYLADEPYWSADGWLPDLTDPATLGCLLALVREATTAYASLTFEPGYLHTEVENLVAALEAAP
jgi:hypothetical protein